MLALPGWEVSHLTQHGPQPSLLCLGHDTGGCSLGPDKVPAWLLPPGRLDLCTSSGASPAALPSRAAWRGPRLAGGCQAAPALLAAGGSADAGPAPLGSNYRPAASGPNPLTRRARSRLAKQGSIRLKCEVRISQKNESVVIAPASLPGRRSPAAAPSLSPALRPGGLLPGRLRLPGFVCLSGLPTGKPCRTVLLGRPAKRRAGRRAGGLAPAAEALPAPRCRGRAWLLAEAPREPGRWDGALAAWRGSAGTPPALVGIPRVCDSRRTHNAAEQPGVRCEQGSSRNRDP